MADTTRYFIEIYHNGVTMRAKCRGKKRYLAEKNFLNGLFGAGDEALLGRPIPDPATDTYPLDDDQLLAYSEFRRKLIKASRA